MADYLFLFTIGPVQEFIAAARRTRDLWAGSKLLSELSRTAAATLRENYKADLIFPAQDDLTKHDVINRIMVRITTDDPKTVGDAIEAEVFIRLESLYKETFDDKKRITWPQDSNKNHRSAAESQVTDLPEIYWAAVPFSGKDGDYAQARDDLEAALAARKNTRNFVQPTKWADYVPKSSIDGLRESVIDEDMYPSGFNDLKREDKIKQLFKNYGAKGAERLSGVDLFKRHYWPRNIYADFPSTSHFAALPLLARRSNAGFDLRTGLAAYLKALRNSYRTQQGIQSINAMRLDKRFRDKRFGFKQLVSIYNYDASLLFASRIEEDLEGVALKNARTALNEYRKTALGNQEPEPYYALLHGDGDFMGKTIDALAKEGIGKHRDFSRALDTFASNVRAIVEGNHLGALVYSGGDDVLALMPLHTVVQCAKELADEFIKRMGGFQYFDEDLKQLISPSLSIGIAICHHLEPLSDALNLARAAEKIAKKGNKNALAITLSKRGTGDRTISGSWSETFYQRLQDLTKWHSSGAIPDSAAYDLHDLIERLGDTLPPAALKAEAVRIVKRKRGQSGQAATANDDLVKLADTLPSDPDQAKQWSVAKFADELIVTREFAKAQGFSEAGKQ